jgi:hypothetical protein
MQALGSCTLRRLKRSDSPSPSHLEGKPAAQHRANRRLLAAHLRFDGRLRFQEGRFSGHGGGWALSGWPAAPFLQWARPQPTATTVTAARIIQAASPPQGARARPPSMGDDEEGASQGHAALPPPPPPWLHPPRRPRLRRTSCAKSPLKTTRRPPQGWLLSRTARRAPSSSCSSSAEICGAVGPRAEGVSRSGGQAWPGTVGRRPTAAAAGSRGAEKPSRGRWRYEVTRQNDRMARSSERPPLPTFLPFQRPCPVFRLMTCGVAPSTGASVTC